MDMNLVFIQWYMHNSHKNIYAKSKGNLCAFLTDILMLNYTFPLDIESSNKTNFEPKLLISQPTSAAEIQ